MSLWYEFLNLKGQDIVRRLPYCNRQQKTSPIHPSRELQQTSIPKPSSNMTSLKMIGIPPCFRLLGSGVLRVTTIFKAKSFGQSRDKELLPSARRGGKELPRSSHFVSPSWHQRSWKVILFRNEWTEYDGIWINMNMNMDINDCECECGNWMRMWMRVWMWVSERMNEGMNEGNEWKEWTKGMNEWTTEWKKEWTKGIYMNSIYERRKEGRKEGRKERTNEGRYVCTYLSVYLSVGR